MIGENKIYDFNYDLKKILLLKKFFEKIRNFDQEIKNMNYVKLKDFDIQKNGDFLKDFESSISNFKNDNNLKIFMELSKKIEFQYRVFDMVIITKNKRKCEDNEKIISKKNLLSESTINEKENKSIIYFPEMRINIVKDFLKKYN